MIAARKWPWFDRFFGWAVSRAIRKRFFNVYVGGLDNLRAIPATNPLVGCANHGNWWDGFILHVFTRRHLPHDIHLAMAEANLRQYRFFTHVGVFGLDLDKPGSAVGGLRYAVRVLCERTSRGRARIVWMFVQGRLVPPGRAIRAQPGAGFIARKAEAQILPVALRYEWLSESRASIFIQVGVALPPTATPAEIGASLESLYFAAGTVVATGDWSGYQPMFEASLSMNKRWDRLRQSFQRPADGFHERNG